MRAVSGCLLALVGLASCVHPAATLRSDLDAMIAEQTGGAVQVSAKVISLRTGETLYVRQPRLLLHPASTMKLLTVATAIHEGLVDSRVTTRLLGSRDGGGPLHLVGGGDPFLASNDLAAMVTQLKARGIGAVTGPIVVDASLFRGPRFGQGWMWDDEPSSYMPHLSALTVERGCVEVTVLAPHGNGGGEPQIVILPASDHVEVDWQPGEPPAAGDGPTGEVRVDRDWQHGGSTVTVTGRPAKGQSIVRRLSVPEPALFAGRVLATLLRQAGVAAGPLEVVESDNVGADGPPPALLELARITRPMRTILVQLMKRSDNLAAESVLRLIAVHRRGAPGDAAAGLELVRAYVRQLGLAPSRYRLVDGSGLSHLNLISAELLVALLADMDRREETARLFRGTLPIAGIDGTLAKRMGYTAAAGKVTAKTGTLSGVSALAGYATAGWGEPVAFAILVQNFVGSSTPWRDLQDRMVVRLVTPARD